MFTKMSIKLFCGLFILLIIGSPEVYTQNNSSLKGRVLDATSGEALPGATILIAGTGLGCVADIHGNYLLKNLPSGTLTVRISYVGYKTYERKVKTNPNKTDDFNFKLSPESITGNEIVVTAQAKGQTEAINQQLSSKAIVNVVSSARIQEVPDANAAESVGRLPGVSVLRSGGEGNKVVIRGLDPKFNNIQVAGIKMASTDNDNRSVDLSMISPYMLEGIEVTKAITPDMDANAIGGTVNFKLKQAPEELKYDFLLQGGYNDTKNTYNDYKIVGNGSNRFFDNKLGVFAQVDIEKRNRNANAMGAGYELISPTLEKPNKVFINSLSIDDVNRLRNRYGGTLVLDYKLPAGSIILNNFMSVGKTTVEGRDESYNLDLQTHSYNTSYSENKLSVMINSLRYVQDLSLFNIESEISHSFSEQKAPENYSFSFQEDNAFKNINRSTSPYDLPNLAYNRISNTVATDLTYSDRLSKEREIVGTLNLTRAFSLTDEISGDLKVGGKLSYLDRSYDYNVEGGFLNYGSGQGLRDAILNAYPWMKEKVAGGSLNLPYSLFIDNTYSSGTFLKGKYTPGPSANVGLLHGILDVVKKYGNTDAYKPNDYGSKTSDYSGDEFNKAGFVMTNLQYLNLIRITAGLRYEEVTREYTAASGNSSKGVSRDYYYHNDTTTTVTHINWLPMVHIKIKPFDWFDVRFAYTNTLSRPDYITIIPRINVSDQSVTWNNYGLKPARSENFDLYFSFHENRLGLFTAGVFKKKIKDMIFSSNGKVLLDPSEINMTNSEKGKFLYTYFNNPYAVDLWGFETSWQTNFWYLSDLLKGLVLDVNYTHIFSEAKYPRSIVNSEVIFEPPWIRQTEVDTFYKARLLNQPNDIVNVSLGYDYKGFSIRGSLLFQSNIFTSVNFWPELRENTDDYYRWDMSVKQELPWEGLQVYCNVTNLSRSVDRNLNQGNGFSSSEQFYGRGIDLGIRYRLR